MENAFRRFTYLLPCISFIVQPLAAKEAIKPNIVILLADDMGYGDLHGYGGRANTPNLDKLAAEGIQFTNCYAGAPNCSPSRASLLTGRVPSRSGMYSFKPVGSPMHMPDSEITLAEMLKTNGYQTAHFGKWHLSCLPQKAGLNQPQPDQQGFEYSFGTEGNAQPTHFNPVNFVRNGKKVGKLEGYSCQILADDINQWVESKYNTSKPFFMYVAFHEPHEKIASPPELIANYPDCDPPMAEYYANIENLDLAAGRILKTLKNKGILENTLVFFASDNGPINYGSQGNLRGFKGEVYEGGIKVPGILSYPKYNGGGKKIEVPIWFPDLFPTICDLCELKMPDDRAYDGISILPAIQGQALERKQPMSWFFYRSSPEAAIRIGDYVLLAGSNDTVKRTHWISDIDMEFIQNFKPSFYELYDLSTDVSQQNNLADKKPLYLEKMRRAYQTLFQEIKRDEIVWKDLPPYNPEEAQHNKPAEFKLNQEIFLNKNQEAINQRKRGVPGRIGE